MRDLSDVIQAVGVWLCNAPGHKLSREWVGNANKEPGPYMDACVQSEELDGAFFESYPERTRTIRPAFESERQTSGSGHYAVLVSLIEPGVWFRVMLELRSPTAVRKLCDNIRNDECTKIFGALMTNSKSLRETIDHICNMARPDGTPSIDEVIADDEAWFKEHGGLRKRVRRASTIERITRETNIVIVSQIEKDMRIRRHLAVPDDIVDYVLRKGDDCIGMQNGEPFIILPNNGDLK